MFRQSAKTRWELPQGSRLAIWQKITLFNPVVYLVSGFRWSFYDKSDVSVGVSLAATFGFMLLCLGAITWIFRTGYKLKT